MKLKHSLIAVVAGLTGWSCHASPPASAPSASANQTDSVAAVAAPPEPEQIRRLTEQDYVDVAQELGVEVAALKAVIEIEAGKTHQGFSAPGRPLVNFDMAMFRQFARRNGLNLARYQKSHPTVFRSVVNGNQAAVNRRLNAARSIDNATAVEGTFWGMFQIGGFNWKKCGCKSIDEFVEMMSASERSQLELFARFITNTGLVKHLKTKNWAAFAKGYNGPSYARRGYHTRLAAAYKRYL